MFEVPIMRTQILSTAVTISCLLYNKYYLLYVKIPRELFFYSNMSKTHFHTERI
ncbi:hypothetical protein SAR03_21380 [Staphylococcus arlettae]|uniref:Uncharacterized protein n=1 Tax=Staphylococcus arlettae TaxID=29378 RepID=A0ABQ0XWJ9_9STAP|nr:hypothetical protein SAR03_21380 [Staphylococcus arlettae]